jgi:hypothetical protein
MAIEETYCKSRFFNAKQKCTLSQEDGQAQEGRSQDLKLFLAAMGVSVLEVWFNIAFIDFQSPGYLSLAFEHWVIHHQLLPCVWQGNSWP